MRVEVTTKWRDGEGIGGGDTDSGSSSWIDSSFGFLSVSVRCVKVVLEPGKGFASRRLMGQVACSDTRLIQNSESHCGRLECDRLFFSSKSNRGQNWLPTLLVAHNWTSSSCLLLLVGQVGYLDG